MRSLNNINCIAINIIDKLILGVAIEIVFPQGMLLFQYKDALIFNMLIVF